MTFRACSWRAGGGRRAVLLYLVLAAVAAAIHVVVSVEALTTARASNENMNRVLNELRSLTRRLGSGKARSRGGPFSIDKALNLAKEGMANKEVASVLNKVAPGSMDKIKQVSSQVMAAAAKAPVIAKAASAVAAKLNVKEGAAPEAPISSQPVGGSAPLKEEELDPLAAVYSRLEKLQAAAVKNALWRESRVINVAQDPRDYAQLAVYGESPSTSRIYNGKADYEIMEDKRLEAGGEPLDPDKARGVHVVYFPKGAKQITTDPMYGDAERIEYEELHQGEDESSEGSSQAPA